jgi:small subunit ribosomal protein S5
VRILLEVAGAQNIIAKTLGRGNPFNAVRATLQGLGQLRDPQETKKMRYEAVEQAEFPEQVG